MKKLLARAGGQIARVVEPYLQQQGMMWVDVQLALELIASMRQLAEAMSSLEAFFMKLWKAGGPVARRILITKRGITCQRKSWHSQDCYESLWWEQ